MVTKSVRERRLDALYKHRNNGSSTSTKELLTFLLATIPHSLVKETVEHFDIKY
jgi:hypothetical protein